MLTFERYAFPRVGKVPVSEVTSADMLEILAPIWHEKAATARKLRQRLHAVLEWVVAPLLKPNRHKAQAKCRKWYRTPFHNTPDPIECSPPEETASQQSRQKPKASGYAGKHPGQKRSQ